MKIELGEIFSDVCGMLNVWDLANSYTAVVSRKGINLLEKQGYRYISDGRVLVVLYSLWA